MSRNHLLFSPTKVSFPSYFNCILRVLPYTVLSGAPSNGVQHYSGINLSLVNMEADSLVWTTSRTALEQVMAPE